MSVNRQYFSKEQVKNKEHYKLLDFLMNESVGKQYNDIRIYPEDDIFIVEWSQEDWNNEYGFNGEFIYVEPGQVVMTEYQLPDNTHIFFEKEEEFEDYLKDWLKEHPGWKRDQYGLWHREEEEM